MRIVIAPDKFKGSLSAVEVAGAMARGVKAVLPSAEAVICPMADGGEGTVDAIAGATGAEVRLERVAGPLPGQEVEAAWAFLPGTGRGEPSVAVIEMAQASGFSLVPERRRDPTVTTTLGTGQLVLAAMDAGCGRVIVGIGGSSTVDGGAGMARSLGYRFLDAHGEELSAEGGSLGEIRSIDASGRDARIDTTEFVVATDVDSPLLGPRGAARVFAPQKGATPAQVAWLEEGLENLAGLIAEQLGVDVASVPGGGAAGGLGAGLVAFCGARVRSGVELVAEMTSLAGLTGGADLVLTGEGSYDGQTARGKTPQGVADIAAAAGVPCVIVAGRVEEGADGGTAPVFCVAPGPMSLEDAMRDAGRHVARGTARLMRLLLLMAGSSGGGS